MPINCQSPLVANPGATSLPGSVVLSFVAIASANTTARIVYEIGGGQGHVLFANGRTSISHQHPVGTSNTPVVFAASLICAPGNVVFGFTIQATVFEGTTQRCGPLPVALRITTDACVSAVSSTTKSLTADEESGAVGALAHGAMSVALAYTKPVTGKTPARTKRSKKGGSAKGAKKRT